MKSFQLFMVLPALLALIGCGGGGRGRSLPGVQCKLNHNPFPTDLSPGQKAVDMKPAAKEMPEGEYQYNGSSLYYIGANDVRIQVSDVKQKNGTFKAEKACVRNARKGMENLAISSEGLAKMTIDAAFNVVAESKVLSFSTVSGKLEAKVEKGQENLNSPELAYKDTKILKVVMLKHNDNLYEVRSQSIDAQGGKYWMSVSLTYSKPKAAAAP